MSAHIEEEFKIEQNKKNYCIKINIQEDQLCLVLIVLSNPPKKYSSYFSLNELIISSKIFDHTKTLFEAKELIKRTVIKKQLLIDEDELRVKITFDTGLGHNSIPFPMILFRDADNKFNNIYLEDPKDNIKKSLPYNNTRINKKNRNINNIDNNISTLNNINFQSPQKSHKIKINLKNLRASIGNNINNKMLNYSIDAINQKSKDLNPNVKFNNVLNSSRKSLAMSPTIEFNNTLNSNRKSQRLSSNVEFNNSFISSRKTQDMSHISQSILFNNSMKRSNINEKYMNDPKDNNKNKNRMTVIGNNNNDLLYNKVDFSKPPNSARKKNGMDYIEINNRLLNNIYNKKNNVNSNFYKNLQYGFSHSNDNINNNHPKDRISIRNIKNNNMNQTYIDPQQNTNLYNINNNNISRDISNVIFNNNIIQNKNNLYNRKIQQMHTYFGQDLNQEIYYPTNPAIITHNQSHNAFPIHKNLTIIPNIDNNDFLNDNFFNNNVENNNINTNNLDNNKNEPFSIDNGNDNFDTNLEEYNTGEQPYKFKNLIQGSTKIKGNLEKFKENQNMGNYVPSGSKFVSYIKFPNTKANSTLSITRSTISTSLTSGSNRIVGIDQNIIKNPSELEEINMRIQRIFNKRNIKYKLLYRATVDGDSSTDFHNKCDNIPNTLILVKTSENKRFGGFTTQTWDGDNVRKQDKYCFIFSIDNMKIYVVKKGKNAICCNPDLGPVFINQIKLLDKFFTQGGSTNKKGKNFDTHEDFEINDGTEKFAVKEVEVYQIK